MTTDPFAEAARAYARERYPSGTDLDRDRRMVVDEFAEWARAYLATQEPTDAEVEAVARKVFETDAPSHEPHQWFEVSEYARSDYRATARAALTAARKARR